MVAEASVMPVEFLTADEPQARLVERETTGRGLEVTVVELPM